MNKEQFLMELQGHLSVLPPEEYHELMEDYEAHFAFGLQSGKTEQEIARELGDPYELAQEAIRERNAVNEHVYWSNPAADHSFSQPSSTTPPLPGLPAAQARGGVAHTFVVSGLVLLNLVAVPLIFSFWAVVVSIAVTAAVSILSSVLVGLDYAIGNGFFPAKAYASLCMLGIGILLGLGSKPLFKGMLSLSLSYMNWNKRVVRGGQQNEH